MKEYGLYLNGEWRKTPAGKTFVTKNPTTGETLAFFVGGTAVDVDQAVEAASRAFPAWKNYPPPKRGEILLRAAAVLRRRKDELGQLVTKEMGKIIAEGRGEIQEAIDFFEYIAGEGRRLLGETTPSELTNKICLTLRQPIGVVGRITPWNFPVAVCSPERGKGQHLGGPLDPEIIIAVGGGWCFSKKNDKPRKWKVLNLNSFLLSSEGPKMLVDFYKQVLACGPKRVDGEYSIFATGACALVIGPHSKVQGQNRNPERIILNFETNEVKGEFERIKALGAKVIAEPYSLGNDPDFLIATLADPDGNYFQIVSPMET